MTGKQAMLQRLVLVVLLALAIPLPAAYAQVPSNALLRVLRFRHCELEGSAFTIEVDGRQYLVTARHNICSKKSQKIALFIDGSWRDFDGTFIFPANDRVDIAAIDLDKKITVDFPFEPTAKGIYLGQTVYLLGYPWGLATIGDLPGSHDEIAFVKAGILSAMDTRNRDAVLYFFDGHNNPGFSGGPIVYRDLEDKAYRVAAVVQGYRNEAYPVLKSTDLPDLKAKAYKDLYTRANSGIIVGYDIGHIVDAIRLFKAQPSP